jgi:hypothetical protein
MKMVSLVEKFFRYYEISVIEVKHIITNTWKTN